MPEVPRAILFDLDETLVNDDAASDQAWREVCKVTAEKLGLAGHVELLHQLNSARREFWSRPANRVILDGMLFPARVSIVMEALGRIGRADEATARETVALYAATKLKYVKPLGNARNTLETLRGQDIKLALITNGDSEGQRTKLRVCGLTQYFPVCMIAEELGYGKPEARVFQTALDALQVSAADAWMVGDDLHNDIGGAKIAGITTVWCDYQGRGLPPQSRVKPDRTIHGIEELITLIQS